MGITDSIEKTNRYLLRCKSNKKRTYKSKNMRKYFGKLIYVNIQTILIKADFEYLIEIKVL